MQLTLQISREDYLGTVGNDYRLAPTAKADDRVQCNPKHSETALTYSSESRGDWEDIAAIEGTAAGHTIDGRPLYTIPTPSTWRDIFGAKMEALFDDWNVLRALSIDYAGGRDQ